MHYGKCPQCIIKAVCFWLNNSLWGGNKHKWSVLPFKIRSERRNKGGGVRARRRSRRSQGHLAVTKSLNLWHFFPLNSALQAASNPKLPLSKLHPSNDYVQGLQILARKPRLVSRRGDAADATRDKQNRWWRLQGYIWRYFQRPYPSA